MHQNSCRERSSEFFGGSISPFHLSCPQYIGLGVVYAPKNRPKKWFKAKTMEVWIIQEQDCIESYNQNAS